MDSIDLAAAKARGIKVYNTPDGPTQAVAELVMGLILSLLRKTALMDRELRQGKWKKEMGSLLSGKNVGIVGMGRIGRCVATLMGAFGAKIAFYDAQAVADCPRALRMEMSDLLKWADIVTLHCATKEKVLGGAQLRSMKPGSWLVNTARGNLLDETVLLELLKSGYLAGAALDVFEREPYDGPLAKLPNVIVSPHIGSYAKESRVQMETDAVKNLLEGLKS
jgi:D-3-phosphoglycerate dehydrogenase